VDHHLAVMMEGTDDLLALARHAEQVGFAGIALADHVAIPKDYASHHPSGPNPFPETAPFPDVMTTAAAMLAVTERLRVMSYVYVLPMREPFSVAKQAGTLGGLSQGRFVLGTGAGWLTEEIDLLGFDPRTRGRRFDEMLAVIRGFWDEGTFEFHGEHYDFGPAGMEPRPSHPVPIWVGGASRAALRRAAGQDGWVGMDYPLEDVWRLLDELAAERGRAADEGRARPGPFEVLVIPQAEPSPALHDDLAARGVTSTVAVAWALGTATLDQKIAGMEAYADRFLR
jgi:probable F420-dependent oxidoreductase